MKLGVVIVVYNSEDVIINCLNSLLKSETQADRIVLCDNASPDNSVQIIKQWVERMGYSYSEYDCSCKQPTLADVTVIRSGTNRGFAGGVNMGLKVLLEDGADLFWLLNPDGLVKSGTIKAIKSCASEKPGFGLMSGRVVYVEPKGVIQVDGGLVRRLTGICESVNQGALVSETPLPDVSMLSYLTGAHLVASRKFVETVGPMQEGYFLYYEEVDWAMRRGTLPLVLCEDADILHHGGTSIGSGSATRRASPFANYFNYRNRMRFMRRFRPQFLLISIMAALARIVRLVLLGGFDEAGAAFRGLAGLPPPRSVRDCIAQDSQDCAFGRMRWTDHTWREQ